MVHIYFHMDERPYSCSECGDKFHEATGLKRHMLKHTATGDNTLLLYYSNIRYRNLILLHKYNIL